VNTRLQRLGTELLFGLRMLNPLSGRSVRGTKKVAEQMRLMLSANRNFRIALEGPPEVQDMARAANDLAGQRDALLADVEAQVRLARASMEEERNRLAALMSELAQAVVVCNLDGRILLYNPRAHHMFAAQIGLGRSIFSILDRGQIVHALEKIRQRMDKGEHAPTAHFIASAESARLLRVQMAPVLHGGADEAESATTGFVLTFEDITASFERESGRERALHALTDGSRAALGNIRAAVEMLRDSPDMPPMQRERFVDVIGDEATALSQRLDATLKEYADALKTRWPLEDMRGADLVETAMHRIKKGHRLTFYDFDLFHRTEEGHDLDDRRLVDLAYTVFDTETTGLEPSKGDEIIQIGAVRIVNGRLLIHESFEQLVDPRRPLSRAGIAIHGIVPEMLSGQPTIADVLPKFHRFCEDTVLVAHNGAFDMRFLQLKESSTGIRFTQPLLDTLLLSVVVHPNQESHALEEIAARLGVPLIGRHTALGDAIVTGEVFLRLTTLLADRGIHTLREASEAAQRTWYARMEY